MLVASLIADGHHLDLATLRVLAQAKGPVSTILISDASPLAGLPPGVYGEWAVDPSGKIVVAGTPYLAGSNQGLEVGLQNLLAASGWTLEQAIGTVTANPARLLGKPVPRLAPGEPADLVIFRCPRPDSLRSRARLCERAVGNSADGAVFCDRSANAKGAGRRRGRPTPLRVRMRFRTNDIHSSRCGRILAVDPVAFELLVVGRLEQRALVAGLPADDLVRLAAKLAALFPASGPAACRRAWPGRFPCRSSRPCLRGTTARPG